MSTVGIDAIRFYTPAFAIRLPDLARARGVDPDKYTIGLGQEVMSIMPPDEDIVTMAAHAALPLITDETKEKIHLLLFATESGVDNSKAAGLWVHNLLHLHPSCRVVELKQACYSATCALQLAHSYLHHHPNEKVLLIASDNARYGLHTAGEPTQGCGAVAMILSASPKLLALEEHQGVVADHVMDFWRPTYRTEAVVDGKYSTKVYLNTLQSCWKSYEQASGRRFEDHARFCYHIPFTRMAEKAHERLSKAASIPFNQEQIEHELIYSRQIGNAYTASLYIGLASLLELDALDLSDKRIGFFSYGSGCVGEFFSGVVPEGYREHLGLSFHKKILDRRATLTIPEYEEFFTYTLKEDGSAQTTPNVSAGPFRLTGVSNHERLYG